MITVYKPQDFMMKFDNIWSAFEFIERNGYKVYTRYDGGNGVLIIEVY